MTRVPRLSDEHYDKIIEQGVKEAFSRATPPEMIAKIDAATIALRRNIRPPSAKLPVVDDTERRAQCDTCLGEGEIEQACLECRGEGEVRYVASDSGNYAWEKCEKCSGDGFTVGTCPDCEGTGLAPDEPE